MSAFTEADVQLVATADHDVWCDCGDPAHARINDPSAHAILTALADAGRLTPPGVKITEEVGVRVDVPHPARKEKAGTVITHFPRENALRAPEVWSGWTVVRRNAIKWSGPWVAADGTP